MFDSLRSGSCPVAPPNRGVRLGLNPLPRALNQVSPDPVSEISPPGRPGDMPDSPTRGPPELPPDRIPGDQPEVHPEIQPRIPPDLVPEIEPDISPEIGPEIDHEGVPELPYPPLPSSGRRPGVPPYEPRVAGYG